MTPYIEESVKVLVLERLEPVRQVADDGLRAETARDSALANLSAAAARVGSDECAYGDAIRGTFTHQSEELDGSQALVKEARPVGLCRLTPALGLFRLLLLPTALAASLCRFAKILETRSTRFLAPLFLLRLGVFAFLAVIVFVRLDVLIVVSVLRERPKDDVEGFGRELASGAGGCGGFEVTQQAQRRRRLCDSRA